MEPITIRSRYAGCYPVPKTGEPIGSGPFLIERWDRGNEITLRRNPRYWGRHPAYLDRIVIRFQLSSENPVDWFRNGELDVGWGIFFGDVPALRREPDIEVLAEPAGRYQGFAFRMDRGGHPALRNKLVRRAIAHGIDRGSLVSDVLGEVDPNLRPLQSLVAFAQSPYYRPNWSNYRYRPAEARRLLEQAGCRTGSDGIYSCAGERLSLTFVTTAGNPNRARFLSLVQEQLRRSGVEVVPRYTALLEKTLRKGEFDVALFGFFNGPDQTGKKEIFGCGGSENFTGYCQLRVTRELVEADRILDARQQARVLNGADEQMARDVPVLPLNEIPLASALRVTVKNFAQMFNPLTNSENWWLER